jgi:citrate lyase beta subunit
VRLICDDGQMIPPHAIASLDAILVGVDAELAAQYPGDGPVGQPVHTAYVSAADASPTTPAEWSQRAIALFDAHRALLGELADGRVVDLVRARLTTAPVTDLRLDFEDGYGRRDDTAEDSDATRAGETLRALGLPSCGVRIKGLTGTELRRAVRSLELVLDGAGGVPPGFVFTVPKFRATEQVTALVWLCEELERAHRLPAGALRFELQIESPQAVVGPDGCATVARAIHMSDGRCRGLHYGTYDYSAACGVAPQHQSLDHPVADHAKAVMQAAAAQTGVWIADGSTQVVPIGTEDQVAQALRRHHRLVTRALERGYYQGWDMHPGHLVTRWLATYTFFRAATAAAAPRLQEYLDPRGGPATDEPATAEALASVILRGLDCGAVTADDVREAAPAVSVEALWKLKRRNPW